MSLIVILFALATCVFILGDNFSTILHYGKAVKNVESKFNVQKARFKDLYSVGLLCVSIVYHQMICVYFFGFEIPNWMTFVLDLFGGAERTVTQTNMETFIGLTLMCLQISRRFYETHFMQIFSQGQMNIFFYLATLQYYAMILLGIIVTAPGFQKISHESSFNWFNLVDVRIAIGIAVFVFAWWNQYQSNRILVNLRKDSSGNTITHRHCLPVGGYFKYVSSPHMFFEIVMYLSLVLIIPTNICVQVNLLFVIANQILYAKSTHQYYVKMFPDYPKDRKIIIPYVY